MLIRDELKNNHNVNYVMKILHDFSIWHSFQDLLNSLNDVNCSRGGSDDG